MDTDSEPLSDFVYNIVISDDALVHVNGQTWSIAHMPTWLGTLGSEPSTRNLDKKLRHFQCLFSRTKITAIDQDLGQVSMIALLYIGLKIFCHTHFWNHCGRCPLINFVGCRNGNNFKTEISKHMDWVHEHFSWNLFQVNATKHLWWYVNIGSGNGLVPSGNKPLPEPMLTQTYVISATMSEQVITM